MNDKPELDLTIEYQVNADLWKHDDDLSQQRNHTFLTKNTHRFTGVAKLADHHWQNDKRKAVVAILISIFGPTIAR